MYSHNRRVKLASNEGSYTIKEWNDLKKKYNYTCPSCKKSEPEITLTVDHIKAVSNQGSNYIENIQPLCLSCNISKGVKTIKFRR